MSEPTKPGLPVVLGSGLLADEMRRMLAADPDRYRPVSWGMTPVGHCPCCDRDVHRVTSRHTGWREGFSTSPEADGIIHPSLTAGKPDPEGRVAGCCCKLGAWGPAHTPKAKRKKARK